MSDGPLVLFVMTPGAIGGILHGLASKLDTVLELDRVMCVFSSPEPLAQCELL